MISSKSKLFPYENLFSHDLWLLYHSHYRYAVSHSWQYHLQVQLSTVVYCMYMSDKSMEDPVFRHYGLYLWVSKIIIWKYMIFNYIHYLLINFIWSKTGKFSYNFSWLKSISLVINLSPFLAYRESFPMDSLSLYVQKSFFHLYGNRLDKMLQHKINFQSHELLLESPNVPYQFVLWRMEKIITSIFLSCCNLNNSGKRRS